MSWWLRLKAWLKGGRGKRAAEDKLREIGRRKVVRLDDYRNARKAAGRQVANREP